MKKKTNNIIGILILLVGISVVVLVMAVSYNRSSEYLNRFSDTKRATAEVLYNNVSRLADDGYYPDKPDELMDIYTDANLLLYGDMIIDESLRGEILLLQRKLLTDELLEKNEYEEQLSLLNASLEELKSHKFYITSVEQLPAIYSEGNPNECFVRVTQTANDFSKYYWSYFLVKQDGNWRISAWLPRDENFEELN